MRTPIIVCVLSLCAAALSIPASAIVVRHDVQSQEFLNLAAKLPKPLAIKRKQDIRVFGMGTWIGENFVLTAAHVASGLKVGDEIADGIIVERIAFPPDGPSQLQDIALLKVEPNTASKDIVAICRNAPAPGETIFISGAGDHGIGSEGIVGNDGRFRAAQNKVENVEQGLLTFLFDAPGSADALPLEGVSGPGDSGGPAFAEIENAYCIAGVSSGQDDVINGGKPGQYGVREYYMDATAHRDWINAEVNAEG